MPRAARSSTMILLLLCVAAGAPAGEEPEGLRFHDPWVREVPPVVERSAGYVRIENTSARVRRLVGVESDAFAAAQLHETQEQDGTASMVEREQITIPAGATRALEPMGKHIMLMGRETDALTEADGDTVHIRLLFANGDAARIQAPVLRDPPGTDGAADEPAAGPDD